MTTRFIPIERLDKNQKYIIVGIPKCGTTSLGKYLTDKGYDVLERELQFLNINCAENHDYSRIPIIVTRNKIERVYSVMTAFNQTLEEACEMSYYQAGIQMWDCLIYSLEYLKTLKDFPHENKTMFYRKDRKPIKPITSDIRKEITDYLH